MRGVPSKRSTAATTSNHFAELPADSCPLPSKPSRYFVSYRARTFGPMRTCTACGRKYKPSSGHHECPACRSKDECCCGNAKQRKSRTCLLCRDNSGDRNPNWQGGKTMHKAGYRMVHVPGHPRATRTGYVFEHIVVMEHVVGRYLVAGENVHHRNGIKDDNRPENLEVWTRPQPSGIRVVEAVAWAKELLRRHEPSALAETRQDRPHGPVLF